MSKIGRMPILLSSAKVEVKKNKITIEGKNGKFEHELPNGVTVSLDDKVLKVLIQENTRENRVLWGLHRALLANKIKGVETGFATNINIVGLGYKVVLVGNKMVFSLGYTNKRELDLPVGISVEIDKTGQKLTVKGADKLVVGNVCDAVRSFRPPEPYKGTGIIRDGDIIIRKSGKTKAA
ncbi:MAG: 50S ribosomal protein L6 [bacterium]